MENATKALLIVGGILIALIITAMLVRTISNISSLKQEETIKKEIAQLAEFNQGYEAYYGNNRNVYGADIISVFNKAKDNNLKYNKDDIYKIQIVVNGITLTNTNSIKKTAIYKCTGITYSQTTGRVSSMSFQSI